jgi:hypothetical protein
MRDSVEIFEKLLERFRFREPVPADVREIIASQKSKALILTHRRSGITVFCTVLLSKLII